MSTENNQTKPWKFCPQCGTGLGETFKFCAECGEPISHEARGQQFPMIIPTPYYVPGLFPLSPYPLNPPVIVEDRPTITWSSPNTSSAGISGYATSCGGYQAGNGNTLASGAQFTANVLHSTPEILANSTPTVTASVSVQ